MPESTKYLHPLELKVLFYIESAPAFSAIDIMNEIELNEGQTNQALSWLLSKAFIEEKERKIEIIYERTVLGKEWAEKGTPLRKMIRHAQEASNPATLHDMSKLLRIDSRETGTSYGILSKAGMLSMNASKQVELIAGAKIPQELVLLENMLKDDRIFESNLNAGQKQIMNQYAKKRGTGTVPFRRLEKETVLYSLQDKGKRAVKEARELGLTGEELGMLSSQMLKDKSWKGKTFRSYNISLPPNRVSIGRRNPYTQFLEQVKDRLVSLGFEEFDGSLVQTEFWNSDALFMPQFHSARDIHDVYYIDSPTHAKEIAEPWFSNVAKVHEDGGNTGSRGWNYSFDKNFTKRLILRSQGTVMSARTLPTAKIPGKYFGVLRVFRRDQIDATHLSDFYQTEGIILGKEVNIRTLLGLLRIFAEEIAEAEEVRYVPGYFPFTEPSVEVHMRHPVLGWIELGGSGIFRPEVTRPLGVTVPVAAWGIGIDRMATMKMGISDLRDLFGYDLEKVILRKGITL